MKDPKRVAAALKGWQTQREPNEEALEDEAFRLREQDRLTYQQIAERQGVGRDKAHNRVYRGKHRSDPDICHSCCRPL